MAYDTYDRLTKTTYPDGTSTSHSYDAEGNKLTDSDRLGRITRYTYDALNRVIKTTYPDGAEMANVYDAAGRMTSSTDARGNTTRYQYDNANRRTAVTDALNNRTTSISTPMMPPATSQQKPTPVAIPCATPTTASISARA